jgi:hypothetical protein
MDRITIQRCLNGEALLGGNYPQGARGAYLFGSSIGKDCDDGENDRITLYRNAMAHHKKRQPEAKTCQNDASRYAATYQFTNNVIYHFSIDGMGLKGNENNSGYVFSDDDVTCYYNVIGNYFKRSELTGAPSEIAITPGTRIYVGDHAYGNLGPHRASRAQDPWSLVSWVNYHCPKACAQLFPAKKRPYQSLRAFDAASLPPYATADQAYRDVLADVGANMGLNSDGTARDAQDSVDSRLVREIASNTGRFIDRPSDVGGWPTYGSGRGNYPDTDADGMSDAWEKARFGSVRRDGTGDYDGDGYTDLEEFLNVTDPVRADRVGRRHGVN